MDKPAHKWGRTPEYMSPTSMSLFWADRKEYYLRYLCLDRPPKFVQTQPMSVGSSFDAYAKSHIHHVLFGNYGKDNEFEFNTIFTQQVDEANRDWALEAGRDAWEQYKFAGGLSDLVKVLQRSETDPRFEFTVKGTIGIKGTKREVPLLGKPDIHLTLVDMNTGKIVHVIIDWKVNGYCAMRTVSPKAGYVMCRDGWSQERQKASKTNNKPHKDAQVIEVAGHRCNLAKPMEVVDSSWATQISTYAWLLGVPVGDQFIAGIDQLACGPAEDGGRIIRVAQHRNLVGQNFQNEALQKFVEAWEVIQSDHIFRDMSREDSLAECEMLDKRAAALRGDGSPEDDLFASMARGGR